MAVHFDRERMSRALEAHESWWNGTLDRPLLCITLADAHPLRPTAAPQLTQATCADFRWTPEQIVDAMDARFSSEEYLGYAFPWLSMDVFGPGVLAAFCGAKLDTSTGRVWFLPQEKKALEDIHVKYDPENVWAKRIKAIYRAGMERWDGSVAMGIPDLGGVLDVAATFRGSEDLLMDLIDQPEEVHRLIGEIEQAWYEAYTDLAAVLDGQGVYTHWSGLLSRRPSYITQCDFCYMIGNPMFREFVLETLRRDTEKLDHVIYHLDGVGQLRHLEDVLGLEKLDAVQWVPGDGQPSEGHWPEVYRHIRDAGKGFMFGGGVEDFFTLVSQVHGAPFYRCWLPAGEADLARRMLEAR